MGKCFGVERRVLHHSQTQEIYDKFGNLLGGGQDIELKYNGHRVVLNERIRVRNHLLQKATMVDFELSEREVKDVWGVFIKMDIHKLGFVTLNEFYTILKERYYSVVGPYLERFFDLIDRREFDKLYFDEFLPGIIAFNLFSRDEMIMCNELSMTELVVFSMLDRDKDDEISKKDLYRLLNLDREEIQVFPINNTRAVELIDAERGDKLAKAEFLNIVNKIPYLVFPAFRLQSQMQEIFCGKSFWRKLKFKMEKKEQEKKLLAERERFFERTKKKREAEYLEKMDFFEMKIKELNRQEELQKKRDKQRLLLVRRPGRRSSDGFIDVKFHKPEGHRDLHQLIEEKQQLID